MSDLVEKYYKMGQYTDDELKIFTKAGYITADKFKELTGNDYATSTTTEATA